MQTTVANIHIADANVMAGTACRLCSMLDFTPPILYLLTNHPKNTTPSFGSRIPRKREGKADAPYAVFRLWQSTWFIKTHKLF